MLPEGAASAETCSRLPVASRVGAAAAIGWLLLALAPLEGGEFRVPVERWPMLVRARLEGGWTLIGRQGISDSRPRRLTRLESGPVLAPGVGVTLGSGDGLRARVDAGARILFQNPDPVEQVPGGSGSDQPGFDRVVSFLLTMGFRL
jgi:hypothetical protein